MGAAQDVPGVSRGVILVRSGTDQAAAWVRRGLVASRVVPIEGWTAICPTETTSRALAPYDDALSVLASRPARMRIRPVLGLFLIGNRAVVTAQPRRWRSGVRWLVWSPGRGPQRLPGLRALGPSELVRAARVADPGAQRSLVGLLGQRRGTARAWLLELAGTLELPVADLLASGAQSRGVLVEPDRRSVARFDALVADQAPSGRVAGREEETG